MCNFANLKKKGKLMATLITKDRRKRAERIANNMAKTPRSKTMIFAMAHRGMVEVTDPELRARLYSYAD